MEPPRGGGETGRTAGTPVVVRGRRIDVADMDAVQRTLEPPQLYWGNGDATIVAAGAAETIRAAGDGRFDTVRDRAAALFADCSVPDSLPEVARPRLFGGFSFTGRADGPENGWAGFPDAEFVLPAVQVVQNSSATWLTTAAAGTDAATAAADALTAWESRLTEATGSVDTSPPGIASRQAVPDREAWFANVESALDRLASGPLEKVVLAQTLQAELDGDFSVTGALDRLEAAYPDCYRFSFQPAADRAFFGATPERLVSLEGQTCRTHVLAGSTGRGDTEADDDALADALADSDKDAFEHDLVLEMIRDRLGAYAERVTVGDREVRRLANVQHLQTPVSATLSGDQHVLDLVSDLHPTPAVGGMPQAEALATIREHEDFDRGWYAAPVGWFDADGDGTFAVAIRSALARDQQLTLFAGAGIVADSDPAREWEELQLKYRPILDQLE